MRKIFLACFSIYCLLSTDIGATRFIIKNGTREGESMRLVLDLASIRLEKLLEVSLPETLTIAVVKSQEEFDSLAGGKLPEWGAGAAIPARDLILLRESMMDRYPGTMANLVQHELAHIALYHRVREGRLPRFIDEGFASWFAGEWTFSNVTTVAAANITGSILPLRRIDDVNTFHQAEANLAYSQSYLVVLYLFDRFGELGFNDLLDSFAGGKSIDAAFVDALEISFWRFENDYRTFVANKYNLLSILSDMSGLWIILALMLILGFLLLRRRRKNALDRWKEEEKYQSTDLDYTGSNDEPWKKPEDDSSPF